MKSFRYKIDLDKVKHIPEEEKAFSNKEEQKEMFEKIMNQGLQGRYKDGMGGTTQSNYRKILKKLDDCTNGILELEDSEFELIKEVLSSEHARFLPSQTRVISLYVESIDQAIEDSKKEKKNV